MLKYGFLAVVAATLIAALLVLLPTHGNGPRPEPKLINADPPANNFVVHDAAPPAASSSPAAGVPTAPPPAGAAPAGGDLAAVMQRLRAASGSPDPAPPADPATVPAPTPAPPVTPPPAPVPAPAPAPRWTSVTGQGTRYRMARTPNGFTVSIDLGGGQVADVNVQPAFGALDIASTNLRIDYLRETIRQNFSAQSGSYTFARDGSVSVAQ